MLRYTLAAALLFLLATLGRATSLVQLDTVLPADISYTGYRLHIRNVEVIKQKGNLFLLRCDLINTGKRAINLGPGFPKRYLQTVYDHTLELGGLLPLAPGLREALTTSAHQLAVGEWLPQVELWVDAKQERPARALQLDEFAKTDPTLRRRLPKKEKPMRPETKEKPQVPQACDDLELAGMRIVFRGKSDATVQLTVKNAASTPLRFSSLPEGLTLTLYLSGATQLSGSARRIRQVDLSSRLAKGVTKELGPGESLTLIETCDTKEATRYTGVIIGQLDGGQVLQECNERNNQGHVLLFD